MSSEALEVGDYVIATLQCPMGANAWEAHSEDAPPNWKLVVKHREPRTWTAGDQAEFRLFRLIPGKRELWLTDSEFGFMPISDRMRPRYRVAIRIMLALLDEKQPVGDDQETLLQAISEILGVINRCIRQDQRDWFEVYKGLGMPAFSDLRRIATELTNLRRFVQSTPNPDLGTVNALDNLRNLGSEPMFQRLDRHIQTTYEGLRGDLSPKKRDKTSGHIPREMVNGPLGRKLDKKKLDWANEQHERTLLSLSKTLNKLGYTVEYNTFIDLFTRLKTGPAIFEVKSVSEENEVGQVRSAIAQLYEYRYRHNYPEASLWIVFSTEPSSDWLVRYLLEDRGISVLWVEGEHLAGPSLQHLDRTKRSLEA